MFLAPTPAQEVRWTRNGRFIATARTHVIPRVTLDDAGTYVCSADNGLGHTGEGTLRTHTDDKLMIANSNSYL